MQAATGNGVRRKKPRRWVEAELRLRAEKREVADALAAQTQPTNELAEGWQERDSPSEDEIRDLEYSYRDALQKRLRSIIGALERLRAGTYGLCTTCGAAISLKRLALDPAVSLCLACQTRSEYKRKAASI